MPGGYGATPERVLAEPLLQLAGRHPHVRDLDVVVAVEVDHRERLVPAALADQPGLHRRRLRHGPGDVADVAEPLGAERLAVADQQVHRGGDRRPFGAVQHRLLVVRQSHGCPPSRRGCRAAGRAARPGRSPGRCRHGRGRARAPRRAPVAAQGPITRTLDRAAASPSTQRPTATRLCAPRGIRLRSGT